MRKVKQGDTVRVHYTGKFQDDTVFDTTHNRMPVQFTIGETELPSGFDQAVIGMVPGESKKIQVCMDKEQDPQRQTGVLVIDRKEINENVDVNVGEQLELRHPNDRTTIVTVIGITESEVILEASHYVTDKKLTFEVQLLEII